MFNKFYEKTKEIIKENYKYLLVLIILVSLFLVELPYKIYAPGGMVLLSDRVDVQDGYSYDGSLGMAYVTVIRGSIPYLLLSYVIPNWDIVPEEELVYANETLEETLKKDRILLSQSMDNAIISAYHLANKDVTVTKEIANITYIDDLAKTDLKLFDVIKTVDGKEVSKLEEIKEIVLEHEVGDRLDIVVLRNNKEINTYATVYDREDGPKIGVAITTTYEYTVEPEVQIKTLASESGPSGGLMMSLAIYNSLIEKDITNGKKIIGTGTIDEEGNVGEIGGVNYKLLGAEKEHCDIFLVPDGNYEEAMETKKKNNLKIEVISVSSLNEAIEKLASV